MIFFENNLLIQSDVVFDSESNDRNFSSLASPDGEKKNIFNFFYEMTSLVGAGLFCTFFRPKPFVFIIPVICIVFADPRDSKWALIGSEKGT